VLKFKGSGGLQELTHPSPSPGPGPGPDPGPTAQHQHQHPLSPRAGCRSCARSSTRHLSTSASSVLWRATRKASESSSCAPRERPLEKYYVCSFRSKCSRRGRPSTCACARSFLTYSGTNAGGMAKGRSAGHDHHARAHDLHGDPLRGSGQGHRRDGLCRVAAAAHSLTRDALQAQGPGDDRGGVGYPGKSKYLRK
jgi:hypothetical protein